MPVVFYVDPELGEGSRAVTDLDTITLSYTFYPHARAAAPVAASRPSADERKARPATERSEVTRAFDAQD